MQTSLIIIYGVLWSNPLMSDKFSPVFMAVFVGALAIHTVGVSRRNDEEEYYRLRDLKES